MEFTHFSPNQINALIDSNHPYNLWTGAVRSGKTTLSMVWMINKISTLPKGYGMITGQTSETIERNFLNDFIELLGEERCRYVTGKYLDVYYTDERTKKKMTRRLFIVGIKDKGAIRRIRGSTLVLLYMDEAILTPKPVFDELLSRLSVKGAKALFTTNPDSPYHYLMKDYVKHKHKKRDWKVHDFTMDDNLSLDEGFKRRLARQYMGLPSLYARMILGKWVIAEGLIYQVFNPRKHIIKELPKEPAIRHYITADFGMGNATVFLLVGEYKINRKRVFIIEDEYYHSGAETGIAKTVGQYVEAYKNLVARNKPRVRRISETFLDPSALALKTELESNGIMITNAKNEVGAGIARVAQTIFDGSLYILKGKAPKTVEEFGLYMWDIEKQKIGKDEPIKENDHCMDAIRYLLFTLLGKIGMISNRVA